MLCSICHKNEAVISYTQISNGEKKEQFLCPECAARYTAFDTSSATAQGTGNLLAGLLASVLDQTGQLADADEEKKTNLVCKKCGMTYNEFLRHSKFGCPECVRTYGFLMDDYLRKIQGSCTHLGKQYGGRETVSLPEVALADLDIQDMQAQTEDALAEAVTDARKDGADEQQLLKKKLQAAVENEEFEEAARLRDAIRALMKQADKGTDAHSEVKTDENMV